MSDAQLARDECENLRDELRWAEDEIARLLEAKRRALIIADERGREVAGLRREIERL